MIYRLATESDVEFLVSWNRQLIEDEGHRNIGLSHEELHTRMQWFLENDYKAVIFSESEGDPVAYALFHETDEEIYLRQFFVRRDRRRQGFGRRALRLLMETVWSTDKRLTVEVLTSNAPGVEFWRSVGYRDYCLKLEIPLRR